MSKIIFVIASFMIIATLADESVDECMQRKLKTSEPINASQIQTGDFQKVPIAWRTALQICSTSFDAVCSQIFRKLTRPEEKPNIVEVLCYQSYLVDKNAEGMLVETFERTRLEHFYGKYSCDETIENFTNKQIKNKMPNGTPAELQCMNNSIDKYMSGRIKAQIMSYEDYSIEIYNDEKKRFTRELREVSEELIECLIA